MNGSAVHLDSVLIFCEAWKYTIKSDRKYFLQGTARFLILDSSVDIHTTSHPP
jgi:hypothetical protein